MTDKTLSLFASPDRENMETPWTWNGYTGATDGWSMILVPGEGKFQPCKLDITRVIPPRGKTWILPVDALRGALESIPKIPEMENETVECPECNGEQVVECYHCGQDMKCRSCNGRGKIETRTKPTGIMVANDQAIVNVGSVPIKAMLLLRLLAVADEQGVDSVLRVTDANPTGANEFELAGGVRVILMPIRGTPTVDIANFMEAQKVLP